MIFQKQRGERRETAAVMVRMRVDDRECDAMLANASSRGVLAMMSDPPGRGSRVKVELGEHTLYGRVRWADADRCGIALREKISVPDLLVGRAVPVSWAFGRGIHRAMPGFVRAAPGDGALLPRAVRFLLLAILVGGASYTLARLGFGPGDRKVSDVAVTSEGLH